MRALCHLTRWEPNRAAGTDARTGFGEAGYWIANNKLPSGSASNSEATNRASTRSALFHLFQSSIQSVFHLMLDEMEASRACPPANSGQRFDNDCRRPTLAASPNMSGIVRHPICVDARCYARNASQYVGNRGSVRQDAHMIKAECAKACSYWHKWTAAVFPGAIAGASLRKRDTIRHGQRDARSTAIFRRRERPTRATSRRPAAVPSTWRKHSLSARKTSASPAAQ
jgi:hypothetical protein